MSYRNAVFFFMSGIAVAALCVGQGKPQSRREVTSGVGISDHDRIERLQAEVADLQKKLETLTRRCETHIHQISDLPAAELPGSIECNQTVEKWAPAGLSRESVDRVCRQAGSGNISVLVTGTRLMVTGPPRP